MKYKNKGSYDILSDMSEKISLVQLMDYLGNSNHALGFFGYWIFESSYKRALVINRESLDMICAPTFGEEQVAKFGLVFNSVR